jgi:hypothetical protein
MWPFRAKKQKGSHIPLDSIVGGLLHAVSSAHDRIQEAQSHRLDLYFNHRCGNCGHVFHTVELDFSSSDSAPCPECDSHDTNVLVPKMMKLSITDQPDSPVLSVPLLTLVHQNDFAMTSVETEMSIEVSDLRMIDDGGGPASFDVTIGPSRTGERPHDVIVLKLKFERQDLREGVQKVLSFYERSIDAVTPE